MKTVAVIAILVILAGCSMSEPPKAQAETSECMNYRSMMTAPIAPDAMKRLRVECEQSRL